MLTARDRTQPGRKPKPPAGKSSAKHAPSPAPRSAGQPDPRPTARPRRIVIVDDHPVVRHGLKELLASQPDLEVAGEAEDAEGALRLAETLRPDLMILDISLRGTSGIEVAKQLRERHPGIRILVSSMHDESIQAERSLRAGVLGYVCKQEPVERTLDAIRIVLQGGVYLSPDMTARILQASSARGREGSAPSALARLSDREIEVFEAIGHGRSTRQIAESLKLSVKTVESHRESIKRKMGYRTGMELVQRAWQWVLGEKI